MKLLIVVALIISASASAAHKEVVFKTKGVVWGFDFLPNDNIIYTLRSGDMLIYNTSQQKHIKVKNVPSVVSKNQGGLLDVLVDTNFKQNKTIYFTYSAKLENGYSTRVASAILDDAELKAMKILFTASPGTSATQHFGSRIVLDKDRYLYFSVGDRGDRSNSQQLNIAKGKIFRIHTDGKSPKDNPFIKDKKAIPAIWSYGHRNPQGLVIHPNTNELWSTEHGPRGGDELNLIEKGKNYGWPVITYGKEYWGPSIGETHKKGMEQPKYHYTPSIATSSLAIHSGEKYPEWKNSFFIGALKDEYLSRLAEKDGKFVEVEKLLNDWDERIRNVKEGPDGKLYVSTDDGYLVRLMPKASKKK